MQVARETVDIGVYVRDIDACLAFYCDKLGFTKVGEVAMGTDRIQHRIQIGGAVLKLNQFLENAPPAGPHGRLAQAGVRYFTIAVKDLPGVVKDLEAKGLEFVVPLRETRPGVWIAMVEDPEGNTVELLGA